MELYWPTLLWCFLLLAIYSQTWWSMFGLRHQQWTFAALAVVLFHTIVLYMLAGFVLPPMQRGERSIYARITFHNGAGSAAWRCSWSPSAWPRTSC